jgi:AraC family transcriptional regulator, regulatory protein of adaptative response / methylated-DNA-[protein]-cysteine methyltransferase
MALTATTKAKTSPTYLSDEDRWAAIVARDRAADGAFYYSVKTTGVYCRPSCAARAPRRENVDFHSTCKAAEAAGFRPCKRCRPQEPTLTARRASAMETACRSIENTDDVPDFDALAEAAGMSRFHFQRVFKSVTGVTPRAYFAEHRARRVRDGLRRSNTVTEAIYGAGFNSNGRFYATSSQVLGMTPTKFRSGGEGTSIRFAVGQSSLGAILVGATEKGVCSILLGDDPNQLLHDLENRFPKAQLMPGAKDFEQWVAKVVGLVENPAQGLDLPLDVRGTAFQQKVWQVLRDIPAGSTASYSDIAGRIGAPRSVRAVARACALNSLAVVIPCHRVVRTDGALSGYRWGVDRKRRLLEREAAS